MKLHFSQYTVKTPDLGGCNPFWGGSGERRNAFSGNFEVDSLPKTEYIISALWLRMQGSAKFGCLLSLLNKFCLYDYTICDMQHSSKNYLIIFKFRYIYVL